MTLGRIHFLMHSVKNLSLKTFIFPYQRSLCSQNNSSSDINDSVVSADKLIEFFKKAEHSIIEDEDTINNEQVITSKVTEDSKSSVIDSSSPTTSLRVKSEKNKKKGSRVLNAFSFVPWTMSTLLKERNISNLLSKHSEGSKESFATLLRYSPFIQLGDFKSRELIGVVIDNVNDTDLYIDFGGKFHCVCPQPANQFYPRGSLVRVRLKDPEITDKFMINTKGISIFEADATLLGPYKGRLVKTASDEDKKLTVTHADGTKTMRPATDEDNVALEYWR
ncbi:unnamed protein product [Heterobilharzia americana]|nr:unnamed protein product [Heterobilharzia americana]CAH8524642.1 unnamed protein product [Heterobilharzia americana]